MSIAALQDIDWQAAIYAEAKRSGKFAELVRGFYRHQIISTAAQELELFPTEAELQLAADKFRKDNQLETITATCQWLEANLISVEDFQEMISYQLIVTKLADRLCSERVESYFHQNSIAYMSAFIYEVMLPDWYTATEIFYAIEEGDLSFASVVERYTTDLELKRRGGYLGSVSREQLRPELAAAVFSATPPQTIEPIKTNLGVHLIRVEEIVKPKLDAVLRERIIREMFELWIAERIATLNPYP
jgi:parvulin-like peptidyl-prolyl isomerase